MQKLMGKKKFLQKKFLVPGSDRGICNTPMEFNWFLCAFRSKSGSLAHSFSNMKKHAKGPHYGSFEPEPAYIPQVIEDISPGTLVMLNKKNVTLAISQRQLTCNMQGLSLFIH